MNGAVGSQLEVVGVRILRKMSSMEDNFFKQFFVL